MNMKLTANSMALLGSVLSKNENLAVLLLDRLDMADAAAEPLFQALTTNACLVKLSMACK